MADISPPLVAKKPSIYGAFSCLMILPTLLLPIRILERRPYRQVIRDEAFFRLGNLR